MEDCTSTHSVSMRVFQFYLRDVLPSCALRNLIPCIQRLFRIHMFLIKFPQSSITDYAHIATYHFGKYESSASKIWITEECLIRPAFLFYVELHRRNHCSRFGIVIVIEHRWRSFRFDAITRAELKFKLYSARRRPQIEDHSIR
jgi:hypothetical protein